MKQKFYPLGWLLRRSTLLLACGLPASAALATPSAAHLLTRIPLRLAPATPITGRVTGPDGSGLPGVTVLVKGTSTGTATDVDGNFTLDAPEGSTLVFSSVGFLRREVPVGSNTTFAVRLDNDTQALNEVVVVGYGTQERADVTGAISSVSGKDIASQPVADPTQALQGRAAGVTVTQNSGAPGGAGGTSVRIRGISSAGNNAPLYVVDGFPLTSGDESQLNAINPNDIESLDVLKDASATAIYGVRAANGVVIITTKRGKVGVSNISFDGYRGIAQVWRKLDLLNSQQYATINNESLIAAGQAINPKYADPASLTTNTDWQSAVFRPRAVIQSYTLSGSGGTEKARYSLSGGYFQQDGTLNGSNFERFTVRANGDINLNKYIKIGNSLSITHQEDRQLDTGNSEYGVLNNVLQTPPTIPVYRADGNYYEPTATVDNYVEPNPVLQSLLTNSKFARNRIIGTFYGEIQPFKGLTFRTNAGADLLFENGAGFTPSLGATSPRNSVAGASQFNNYNPTYLIENTLTYDHTFLADKLHVTALLGQSAQQFQYNSLGAGRSGYINNQLVTINAGPVGNASYPISNYGTGVAPYEDRLASTFGRLNLEYLSRYLITFTVRRDGSSQFPPGYQFGVFPGGSIGWRVSEEAFLKGNPTISNLKIRAGYGKVGNPLNAGRFAYLAAINTNITTVFGPSSGGSQPISIGAAPTRQANGLLRWEDNEQENLGVDLGLFNNRVELTVDVYNRRSLNLLSNVTPPLISGTYEAVPTNAISAYNRGLDVALTTHNFINPDGVTWTTGLTFSTFKNRIDKLNVADPFNGLVNRNGAAIVRYDAGQPFGAFYGYVADGLFQNNEEVQGHATQTTGATPGTSTAPGDIRFKDLNGDGKITDEDRTFIGSPLPDFTYGINNTVNYKGFDLTAFIQGSQGNKIYDLNRVYTEGGLYSNGNSSTRVLARWTGENSTNDVPRAVAGDPNQNLRVSSYFLEDGSYIRLKTLSLGYNFSKSLINRLTVSNMRLYVSAQNLVTLTKYRGFDPEVGVGGVDRGIYPQSRVYLVGLNIGL